LRLGPAREGILVDRLLVGDRVLVHDGRRRHTVLGRGGLGRRGRRLDIGRGEHGRLLAARSALARRPTPVPRLDPELRVRVLRRLVVGRARFAHRRLNGPLVPVVSAQVVEFSSSRFLRSWWCRTCPSLSRLAARYRRFSSLGATSIATCSTTVSPN